MAATVPYTGDPQVGPSLAPTPEPAIQTPLAAFGGLTAEASTHAGQISDQVGNELFTRAVAMEQLHQEALANEAATNYSTKIGERQAQFLTSQGKDSVDGLMPFIADANKTRDDIRQGLTSPYAQSLYDRDSRSLQNWSIRSASLHAAQQGKAYSVNALTARTEELQNRSATIPMDGPAHDQALDIIRDAAQQRGEILGLPPERVQADQEKEVSKYNAGRLKLMAKEQPFAAQGALDGMLKKGEITGDDAAAVQDLIKSKQYNVGSRIESAKILAGDGNWVGESVVSSDVARAGIKGIEGGNYSIQGPQTKNGRGLGAYQVMDYNLAPWLKEAGMQSMTKEEFLASPQAQDQLFDFKFGQLMKTQGSFNKAARAWFTGNSNAADTVSDGYHTMGDYLKVANASMARASSQTILADKARSRATELDPNDPVLADTLVQRTQATHQEDIKVQKDGEQQNTFDVVNAALSANKDGKLPTTVDEMIANNPDAAKAWEGVKPGSPDYQKVLRQLEQNAKGPGFPTVQNLDTYRSLRGEQINDPEAFLKRDILKENLTPGMMKEMITLQMKTMQQAEKDPATNYALRMLEPSLYQVGLTRNRDKQGFDQFTGSLFDELRDFQDLNKRPPRAEEIQQIGKQLMQKQGAGWFTSGTELFRVPIPDDAAKIIREDPQWAKIGITPTDDDIRKIYVRKQYQQLYGGAPKATP